MHRAWACPGFISSRPAAAQEDQFYAQLSLFSLKSLYMGLANGAADQAKAGTREDSHDGTVKDAASEMGSCAIHYFSVGRGGAVLHCMISWSWHTVQPRGLVSHLAPAWVLYATPAVTC